MYLCNYNQKNVRKNIFLWAIGKIPLFMRFFIMFMFMSIGISYAETVHSQNAAMEFRFQDVTIEKALKEIEKKTGYNFFYNTKDFNVKRKISFSAKGMNLSEVLNGIFANSQVDYVINGTDIVLKRREEVSNVSNEKYQIKGSVRDGNGEPVIGASVVLKGHTETGVITDIDGNFVLTVPAKKVTLSISYIGYDPVNVEATVGTFVKVVMKESSQTLNEVVVVGYGTQKKESVVGSVQMVKPDELKVPSSQLSTGFAGRLAGVVAVQRSGEPGADGADFWIRGISTFNGTRSPLIIIDGVQASSGDLNAIDPEVIESFSVLKDATATALYGSRGANGVMIVKTKSGRESDKAIVNIRLENAYSTHTKTPKFVDGVRYMEMYNEAVLTRGTGEVLYSDNKIAGTRAGLDPLIYPNVNWYDELFRSGAMNQNINVTIRGGSKKLDYFSSVSVNHDSGVLRNTDDFSYKNNLNIMRYVFQNNFNLNLSKSSKLSLNLNVQLRDYSGPTSNTSDLFGMVMESNPVDFPVRFPDDPNVDYIRWGGKSGGKYNSGFRNPYAEMARGYQSQFESTVMANLKFEQKLDFITEGLSMPRFIHNQQIDRIIERRIPLPIVRTNHVFRQRMESRNKDRHHTGQTFQPFGVILAATCLPLFIASGQAADELGFPVMDGIPEQKIAVTDIQPHRHIFRIRKGIIFRIGNQLVIACLKIFRLLPAAYHIIIAWKFLKFTEQFTQKTFIRHLFSILFETGNIQAGSNLIPHLPHLPAKEALACNFIPARCLKETIEMLQIEPAIFFQPGRIVIIIRKAFTFRIEHHFVLILLFVFA